MSAVPQTPLTPALSPEGEREPGAAIQTPSLHSSLSRSRERAGVRVGVLLAIVAVAILAPLLNLVVPQGSVFHMSDYAVALVAKIMCYAIAALAMDLIW